MKNLFFTIALVFGNFVFAQDFYDTYPQDNYNGYEYYNSSYDYPEDYYYNYPQDYYPDEYYQGYYNDYRQAIFGVDWNGFFIQYNLSPWQRNQIIILNNRFASYNAWNSYYRWNPDRWYYDRFYAMQNILGPNIFVVYQNVYFQGRSPIRYYHNHRANFYVNRYPVRPVYRNVNINIYRVNRNDFRGGFRNPPRNAGLIKPNRNDTPRSGSVGGFGNNGIRNNRGFRSSNSTKEIKSNNSGIRNLNSPRSNSNQNEIRNSNNGGFRNNSTQNNENRRETVSPRTEGNSRNNSGFRFSSR